MSDVVAFPKASNMMNESLEVVELLFFAYRDFVADADILLEEIGYGRAHHRVIHFVSRHPGMRVADLLEVLAITKQSLNRVLRQLIEDDFVAQKAGTTDKRERRLHLTEKGTRLATQLQNLQCARISRALADINQDPRPFLRQMISDKNRAMVEQMLRQDDL